MVIFTFPNTESERVTINKWFNRWNFTCERLAQLEYVLVARNLFGRRPRVLHKNVSDRDSLCTAKNIRKSWNYVYVISIFPRPDKFSTRSALLRSTMSFTRLHTFLLRDEILMVEWTTRYINFFPMDIVCELFSSSLMLNIQSKTNDIWLIYIYTHTYVYIENNKKNKYNDIL